MIVLADDETNYTATAAAVDDDVTAAADDDDAMEVGDDDNTTTSDVTAADKGAASSVTSGVGGQMKIVKCDAEQATKIHRTILQEIIPRLYRVLTAKVSVLRVCALVHQSTYAKR